MNGIFKNFSEAQNWINADIWDFQEGFAYNFVCAEQRGIFELGWLCRSFEVHVHDRQGLLDAGSKGLTERFCGIAITIRRVENVVRGLLDLGGHDD